MFTGSERGGTTTGRTVQSLERAFAILEAAAGSDQPLSLVDLSRVTGLHTSTTFHLLKTLTGLHTSTTFHLLKTLVVLGYVRQDEAKRYRIGVRFPPKSSWSISQRHT